MVCVCTNSIGACTHSRRSWHPEFIIHRELITLQRLNEKADKIYDRIIPNPGGDCKIVAWPGTQKLDDWGFEVEGRRSSIVCGLKADEKVDGTEVPLEGQKPNEPQSTDGRGAQVIAPDPALFKALEDDRGKFTCFAQYNSGPLCVPPGTYSKQSGQGFEILKVDSLFLPEGGGYKVHIHYQNAVAYRSTRITYQHKDYDTNQGPTNDKACEWPSGANGCGFFIDMYGIYQNRDGKSSIEVKGPDNWDSPFPMCCLYADPRYLGNVWSKGEGGGDVPDDWKKSVESVKCWGGGQIFIFADHYGDDGYALITGEVEDLKEQPYGNTDNFANKIVAVWIDKQPNGN